jgi:CopG family transcriptional regulator, nickel-responsive regulator
LAQLVRLSFSLDEGLHGQLERLANESGYTNRSEFVRDLVRNALVREEWKQNEECLATLTIVYDHHGYNLAARLIDLQHAHEDAVLANLHLHLSHERCAEVIVLRGKADDLKAFVDSVRRQKGVLHAALSTSSLGDALV